MYPKSLLWVPKWSGRAPLLGVADEHRVPNMYIVKMRNVFTRSDVDDTITAYMVNAKHIYNVTRFKGFTKSLSESSVQLLRDNPNISKPSCAQVEYVVEDSRFYLSNDATQENAPYGVTRISHQNKRDNSYVRNDSDGNGTCVYAIDTGIKINHLDFGGRASWAANFADDEDIDGAGHETFVAGIVGSNPYGVAGRTQLLAIEVFRNDGTADGNSIIAAIDWVAQDAQKRNYPKGTAVNLFLGDRKSQASNDAMAGCSLPALSPQATRNDAKTVFNNYGFVTTASGTSAASPIVAGLGVCLHPIALCDRIKELSIQGILTDVADDTINALAVNGNPSG
ncbi:peptidase S8/S53 domain-containing protein [Xylaria telfairii]|nr:peptidase S8/S53 domain-containing protein [Xylaria telfairii]